MNYERAMLTRQHPQGAGGKRSLLLGVRFINVIIGIVGAIGVAYDVQYPHQYNAAFMAGILSCVAVLILELLLKLFVFRGVPLQFLRWFNIGGIAGALISFPLIITPTCGWIKDECKPVQHQVHHGQ